MDLKNKKNKDKGSLTYRSPTRRTKINVLCLRRAGLFCFFIIRCFAILVLPNNLFLTPKLSLTQPLYITVSVTDYKSLIHEPTHYVLFTICMYFNRARGGPHVWRAAGLYNWGWLTSTTGVLQHRLLWSGVGDVAHPIRIDVQLIPVSSETFCIWGSI